MKEDKLREKYCKFINSNKWRSLREKVLIRDDFTCQECGDKANHVHHKSYEEFDNIDLLVSLCEKCHNMIHDEWFNGNFCEICKERFDNNDLDMVNGTYICRNCE